MSSIKNKSVVLIDDSLVRGTTCHKIVKMLYNSGAKEVHVRIASPEIKFPDFYGIDMPTRKELLAANKNLKEIRDYIGADSIKFLTIDGMYNALCDANRNNVYQFTDHYFTGEYQLNLDQITDEKVTQLSLAKSNN